MRLVWAALAFAFVSIGSTGPARGDQQSVQEMDVRAEVAAAIYYNSSVVEAIDREHGAEVQRLRQRIGDLEQRVEAGDTILRSELTGLQERLVRELADRDATLARIVASFRAEVLSIASTPRGLEALRLYNAGNWTAANAIFSDIIAAADRAELLAGGIRRAAPRRQRATLALQSRQQGLASTHEVIGYFEEVTSLDAGVYSDWVELGWLYVDAGNLPEARRAAERAAQTAANDWQRGIALEMEVRISMAQGDLRAALRAAEASLEVGRRVADSGDAVAVSNVGVSLGTLGDVLVALGDLGGARARYEESLRIAQRLAAANPSSSGPQRHVSVSLNNLGDVLVSQGDLASARAHFEQSLALRQRLAAADPSSVEAQRDVAVSLERLGDVLLAQGDLAGARVRHEESLRTTQRLAAADPSSAGLQRDLFVSQIKFGDVLVALGDLGGARACYEDSSRLAERLAANNPSSTSLQRDVSVSFNKLGHVLVALGDLGSARARFEQSLSIRQPLATANPSSAEAQRDVGVSLDLLGDVLVRQGDLASARARFEQSLALRQRLAAADPSSAEALRSVGISFNLLGDVLARQGDLASARAHFEQSLALRQRVAAANPSSVEAQRDVWTAMWRLQRFPESGITWTRIVATMEDMERRSVLLPTDRQYLDRARANAESERHQ